MAAEPRVLPHAPDELTERPLRRLGEGVGKVVYASEHWVVRRDRTPTEQIALIALWRVLRRVERHAPASLRERLVNRPAGQLRMLRLLLQPAVIVLPRSLWFMKHIRGIWTVYTTRDEHGERLAMQQLHGTGLVPERITFPTTRVRVSGWPGWLYVSEAVERVDGTLHERLWSLARAGRYEEVEVWLDRFLDCRRSGWERGTFSVDAHLKNFGVTDDRVVLLDPGGLTDQWGEIEHRLLLEESVEQPHIRLGLGTLLAARPDIAERFNEKWKALVNRERVRFHWPGVSQAS